MPRMPSGGRAPGRFRKHKTYGTYGNKNEGVMGSRQTCTYVQTLSMTNGLHTSNITESTKLTALTEKGNGSKNVSTQHRILPLDFRT